MKVEAAARAAVRHHEFCGRIARVQAEALLADVGERVDEANELLIHAAIADLVHRRGGSEAAFKGNPKGNRDSF